MEMTSLDDDLAAWAVTVRLPDAEADVIYRQITVTPAPAHRNDGAGHRLPHQGNCLSKQKNLNVMTSFR